MKQTGIRWIFPLGIVLLIGSFIYFDLAQYLSLDELRTRHAIYQEFCRQYPILSLLIYFFMFLTLTALSLPGVSILILVGGSLFGFIPTLLVTSCADVLGSTLAFLGSRHLFGNYLQERYPARFRAVNAGIDRKGWFYLLYLRLMPIFPCILINLLMGLTRIRVTTFYWGTQLGKLPHNMIYSNAGTQLNKLDSVWGALSPGVFSSFLLIALFPMLVKLWLKKLEARQPEPVFEQSCPVTVIQRRH